MRNKRYEMEFGGEMVNLSKGLSPKYYSDEELIAELRRRNVKPHMIFVKDEEEAKTFAEEHITPQG